MNDEERKAAFNQLFDSMEGRNMDKVRRISEFLCCTPNTVRIWRLKETPRVIPEAKLKMLQRQFAPQ